MVNPRKEISPLPQHVAIIMDGNGRWAQEHHLPRLAGHKAGTENIRRVIEGFADYGISYLTFYAFSTENWSRPPEEVAGLLEIIQEVLDREVKALHQAGIKLRHIGDLEPLSAALAQKIQEALDLTRDNSRMTVCVAFNYGGRAEILRAVRRLLRDELPPEVLTEGIFYQYLDTAGLPDPDLIIRTAGEMRLSNFLIWQAAYAEFYSTPTLWPDFGPEDIEKALLAYSQRQRRFGGLPQG